MLTPGQILQNRRKELKKTLFVVSQETRIQERFLRYIEADDYSKFDSGVFVNGFIKIYADYLGLDVERMLALYRRASKQALKKVSARRKGGKLDLRKLVTPINAAIVLVAAAVIAGLFYLNMQFGKFQRAPELEIASPSTEQTVETDSVSVLGVADTNSEVFLNGEPIDLNADGSFEYEVVLKEGVNTISIEAVNPNNSDQKTTRSLEIEYRKPEPTQEDVEPVTFEAYLQISGEDTWVQFIVDDSQKYAQVLSPGRTETFVVERSVEVVTGKPQNTKLYINGKNYPLNVNSSSGVASISCTVKQDTIDCSE
jgi:cytoskeletal protein RodZ